jgi:hypothetical protein
MWGISIAITLLFSTMVWIRNPRTDIYFFILIVLTMKTTTYEYLCQDHAYHVKESNQITEYLKTLRIAGG